MKILTTIEEVRGLLGDKPSETAADKIFPHLSSQAEEFIGRSPFLLLSTRDNDGNVTTSPKGDNPGFVYVSDPHTLYIPERKGNRLIVSLQNILATGSIGLIFLVPNTGETLRISGRCEIVLDEALNTRLADRRGRPALLALKITIEESYFHCAKALMRSGLWQPGSWGVRSKVSFGRELAEKNGQCHTVAAEIDQYVVASYARSAEEEGMIG